ncbi:hypothetical protein [Sporolactobacillus laevolacticus]|uniref:Uncharacterized protein n=1 Tax=Sporolactobacillus laevolacticus DSM 442 TaxID=1395513 RepID=V6J032_9BACL|nr:hypothetical protein [Sporolactobacillus laevolacticus]EST13213.1 hypothetical protein P343_02570 [Sporolactobacillus laevolacticus DSM 442]
MPNIIDIANVAIDAVRSLNDGEKRSIHVGEAMAIWTYGSYLDGVIEQYQCSSNKFGGCNRPMRSSSKSKYS